MRHEIISLSKAKATLSEFVRKVDEEGMAFILTRDGEPVSALVPMEDYESLLETADILSDEVSLSHLEAALEDEKRGRLWKRDKNGKWVSQKSKKHMA